MDKSVRVFFFFEAPRAQPKTLIGLFFRPGFSSGPKTKFFGLV